MAYAALVSLNELLDQINNHHFYIPQSDEQQILDSLPPKISFLQAFLDDYSLNDGETIQPLADAIRDDAYQAQDTIELHISVEIQAGYQVGGSKKSLFQSVLSISNIRKRRQSRTRHKYYKSALLVVVGRIDVIAKAIMDNITCRAEELQMNHSLTLSSSSDHVADSKNDMVGHDEELIVIQEQLCGASSKLKVIPVVGMGGIGKTTFARNIFEDSLIAYHFHTRAWATISQQYHLKEVLLSIVQSLTLKANESENIQMNDEELSECVYRRLKGKRYLIIMDDMWSTEAWDDVRRIFPDDNNGSRILITSRIRNVAEYACSCSIHHIRFLNDDESWTLLKEKVFVGESCPPELEEIGMMVAKNCLGLPLAIVVVAGILKKMEKTIDNWKTIADNVRGAVASGDGSFSKILGLSYNYLPNHLKACFLYMGGFVDYKSIRVSILIKLWIAEGFLKKIESKSFEVAAEECLEDLVKRNLVLVTKTWTGRSKFCSLHDLLRDLCKEKAEEEGFLVVADYLGRNIAKSRRVSVPLTQTVRFTDHRVLLIRSILKFDMSIFLSSIALWSSPLRVLHMPNTWLVSFPEAITQMFHLRYLAFTHSNMNGVPLILPASMSKLRNLQTLIIYHHSTPSASSPTSIEIWKMPQLRHVILVGGKMLIPLPPRNGGQILVAGNLLTVSRLMNFVFTSEAIAMMPNVKKLKAVYTSREWSDSEPCLNNLLHLHQLEILNLDFTDTSVLSVPYFMHYGLPASLKKLSLRGCRPPSDDMSIIGSLPNLEVLKLKGFYFADRRWESKEGGFMKLRFLQIVSSDLVNWRTESSHFPRLEHVILKCCGVLEEIPSEIGDIATLKVIEVDICSQSVVDSAKSIEEEQESMGNDLLVVINL